MRARIILVMAAMALVLPLWATGFAAGMKPPAAPDEGPIRKLTFYNTHTQEKLTVSFRSAGQRKQALEKVNFLLRDHRNGKVKEIDSDLLDLLYNIKTEVERKNPGVDAVFHVISGYRSPESNEMLRKTRGGQAKNSRHMHGDAIDIRVPGVKLEELRNIAWCQQGGGVGYYAASQFVHVDTHKVRYWGWNPGKLDCKKVMS